MNKRGHKSFVGLCPFLFLTLLLLAGCNPDRCHSYFGQGGTIDITMPEYSELQTVGGALTLRGGHSGIFVTRTSYTTFVAFDCTCPNEGDVRLLPDDEWGNSVLTCPTCLSRFNALDGTPLTGSATPCPLYEYTTSFDGRELSIY